VSSKQLFEELRFEEKPVEEVVKGQIISMPVSEKVRRADKLYKVVDIRQLLFYKFAEEVIIRMANFQNIQSVR
jgi:hypothetical protein